MRVTLLQHGNESLSGVAALACTSDKPIESLQERGAILDKVLERVYGMGHESVLEHMTFTFAISGVSRALSHQLVRHRIASYSQRSQRYVAERQFHFVVPPSIAQHPTAEALFTHMMGDIQQVYDYLVEAGIPAEDARYVLPNATTTQLIVTMNARSLLHFFSERLCSTAQWEIRQLAQAMLAEAKKISPIIMQFAGPKCMKQGFCKESYARWEACQLQPRKD